jgi:hypothetical protein
MAIAAAIDNDYQSPVNTSSGEQIVRGTLTLTGNYGSSGSHGDTVDFATLYGIQSSSVPSRVFIYQQPPSGTAPGNCTGVYCPGISSANGVVSFANAGTELTGGSAYTGAAASAKWKFEATFKIFQ